MSLQGLAFDFNGTLSDDEPILCAIFMEMFAELGRPLSEREYYEHLSGHTDNEIFEHWLGRPDEALVFERIRRYRERVSDGSTIDEEARAAVRYASSRAPLALVTSALRAEVDHVIGSAGLADLFTAIVALDDVTTGKPHPEPFELAAKRLGVPTTTMVAFEDTEAGVASAKAAGMHVIALSRTLPADRLAPADEVIPHLTVEALERVLG